jgi:hypothetical protein
MKISLQIKGLETVQSHLQKMAGSALNKAAADAINDTAFFARKAIKTEMRRVFDRPTTFITDRTIQFVKATPDNLQTTVMPTYIGGKTVDPQKILAAETMGGARRLKRSEVLLRNVGILPPGYQTAIPRKPFPGSDDGNGNLRGPFMVQLLSYLQAFGETGYRANMTQKRKDKLANKGRTASGYKTINGFMYFVSSPSGRGVHDKANRAVHLEPGIWARKGTHGSNVMPVLLFVKPGNYKPRLSMERAISAGKLQEKFESRLRFRIRQAVER